MRRNGSHIFILGRTKNPNRAEIRIQEDNSSIVGFRHEDSIVRIEGQITYTAQLLCLCLRNKTTDDQPSVSGHFTNDDHAFLLLPTVCGIADVLLKLVNDDKMPAGCLHWRGYSISDGN